MPGRKIPVSSKLQGLVDSIAAQRDAAQERELARQEQSGDGGFGIGRFMQSALGTIAKPVIKGTGYAFKGLDLTRQWVAKPMLGAMVAGVQALEGQDVNIRSIHDLRRTWDDVDLGRFDPVIRFTAEMAADPLVWTGFGAWGTAATRGAKIMGVALEAAEGVKSTGLLGRAVAAGAAEGAPASARWVGRLAQGAKNVGEAVRDTSRAFKAELGFSNEARQSLTNLSKSAYRAGLKPVELESELRVAFGEMERLRLLPRALADDQIAKILKAPELLDQFRPGTLARITEPLRLSRILGPVDSLFENVWRAPFGAVAPVLGPLNVFKNLKGETGIGISALDWLGNKHPIKELLWVAEKVGPTERDKFGNLVSAPYYSLRSAATKGQLGQHIFSSNYATLSREAARTTQDVAAGLKGSVADPTLVTLTDMTDVLAGVRAGGASEAEALLPTMNPYARDKLFETLKGMPDEDFTRLVRGRKSQDGLFKDLERGILGNIGKDYAGLLPSQISQIDPNLFNRSFGFTMGMVNGWKSFVTSYNPSFQLVNWMDNIFRTGWGVNGRELSEIATTLRKAGYPEDRIALIAKPLGEQIKALRNRSPELTASLKSGSVQSVETFMGELAGHDISSWKDIPGYLAARLDQSAQARMTLAATQRDVLRQIFDAPPESLIYQGKLLLDQARAEESINPTILDEIEKLVTSGKTPEQIRATADKMFDLNNLKRIGVENQISFRQMPPRWQSAWRENVDRIFLENPGLGIRQSMIEATRETNTKLDEMLADPFASATEHLPFFNAIMNGQMKQAGVENFDKARRANRRALKASMTTVRDVAAQHDTSLAAHLTDRITPVGAASDQADAIAITGIAKRAANSGSSHMLYTRPYFRWEQNVTNRIVGATQDMGKWTDVYQKAIMSGTDDDALFALSRLSESHGSYGRFLREYQETKTLPSPVVIRQHLYTAHQEMASAFVGQKIRLGDHFGEMAARGEHAHRSIERSMRHSTNEVFQIGDLATQRARLGGDLAVLTGNEAEMVPMAVDNKLARETIIREKREAANAIQDVLGFGDKVKLQQMGIDPQALDDATVLARIKTEAPEMIDRNDVFKVFVAQQDAQDAQLANLLANPPSRPYAEFEADALAMYPTIGEAHVQSLVKLMPKNVAAKFRQNTNDLVRNIMQVGFNDDADARGLTKATTLLENWLSTTSDSRTQKWLDDAFARGVQESGIPWMRNRMVDYTNKQGYHEIIQSVMPFASFQLALPGYLARTFMERPGIIAAMNHFTQAGEENGLTGPLGLAFGAGGLVLAPQMRLSYLPILAGQNFVNPEDHPFNQWNDIISMFGFSPGPHVQIASDAVNRFADQSGITGAVGLTQAAPEFRGGILPQWRVVQDLTAIAGINQGSGLTAPIIGASSDLREREVKKVLAGRLATRIDDFRRTNGREPHPDEVQHLRDYVAEHDLKSARIEVAARDFIGGTLGIVRPHDPEFESIRERAAQYMKIFGVDATARNVTQKYKSLDAIQKAGLNKAIPEFGDVLAIPPYQESPESAKRRKALDQYYRNTTRIQKETARLQRALDTAVESGKILPKEYRDRRADLRQNMSAAITAFETSPDFAPYINSERQAPSKPEEIAYLDFNKLEPQDLDGDGIVGTTDMKAFFQARNDYYRSQPTWIQDYITTRREMSMSNTEQEFTRAQTVLNQYYDVPKYVGLSNDEGDAADGVLSRVDAFLKTLPAGVSLPRARAVMTMPGLAPEERIIALRALQSQRNPARYQFWTGHQELSMWYPDMSPAEPEILGRSSKHY